MSAKNQLDILVSNFQKKRPLRAGSLIITIYGDAIVPRGGTVWLGSLMKLVEPMGISQRLVRTSVYRLVQESWLQTEKVGRCSYYSLTGPGLAPVRAGVSACLQPVHQGVERQLVPGVPEPAGSGAATKGTRGT